MLTFAPKMSNHARLLPINQKCATGDLTDLVYSISGYFSGSAKQYFSP